MTITQPMKLTIAISALLGVLIGGSMGVHDASWNAGAVQSARVIAASSATAAFAAEQFHYANPASAREAVLLQIDILQQFERVAPSPIHERNLGFACARLAIIEQAMGQENASQIAFQQAKDWFRKVHPAEEVSDAQLESFVHHIERTDSRRPPLP